MNKLFKLTAIAVALAVSGVAQADVAETKGGIKIKTEDGRFEANINGRIHLDTYVFGEDDGSAYGSGLTGNQQLGGVAFRRTYLTLTGKLYGWKYKFENDFTTTAANGGSFREMWVSTNVGPGELILGQFKPFRGMEELTSSNDITMAERPVTSATGIYNGRQFLMGAGYKSIVADQFGYGVHLMQLSAATAQTEGLSYGGRVYWFPSADDGATIHAGLSYSVDNSDAAGAATGVTFGYAGRQSRGFAINFGTPGTVAGGDNSQTTIALEGAASFGPFTVQAEYAQSDLDATHGTAPNPVDSEVVAYYLQGSWFVTGESKSYKKDRGAFGSPKPAGAGGAWEVTARYEVMENSDSSAATPICTVPGGVVGGAAITGCEITTMTLGVNWYANPNVRFMLNYYMGEADLGLTGGANQTEDEPTAITLRTQLAF